MKDSNKIEITLVREDGTYKFSEDEVYVLFSEKRFGLKGIHPKLSLFLERFMKDNITSLTLNGLNLQDPQYLANRLKFKKKSLAYLSSLDEKKKKDFLDKAFRLAKKSKDSDKDLLYYSVPFHSRAMALSFSFREASWRNQEYKNISSVDLFKTKNPILNALEDFVVGILGDEKLPFVEEGKSLGENFASILLGVGNCADYDSAQKEAVSILEELGIPRPQEILDYKFYQFINEDYQVKILLGYLLAFSPKMIIIDYSSLTWNRNLADEITSILISLMKKRHFYLAIFDDVLFDKKFENKHVDVLSKEGNVISEESYKGKK